MSPSDELETALRDWLAVFMRRSMRELVASMKDSGLSMAQLTTLFRLHHQGSCPVSGIGDDLGVTAAAASQMVDRLVNLGLLNRAEDSDDRRVKHVHLTPEGVELVRRAIEARMGWMRDLSTHLSPSEQATVIDSLGFLTKAAQSLETQAEAPVGA